MCPFLVALANGEVASTGSGTSELADGASTVSGTSEPGNQQPPNLPTASFGLPPLQIPLKFAVTTPNPKVEASSSSDKTVPEALQGLHPLTAGGSASETKQHDNVVDVDASETKQETPALCDEDSAFMLGQLG